MSKRRVLNLLDFIFEKDNVKYNYPTIIFYQVGTNLTTMWQSSRRGYRLIQTVECRTYYIAYRSTLQENILELMGEKKMATSILQGKFSASALTTDNDLDVRYRLLNALKNNIRTTNIETVEAQFKKMNQEEQGKEIPEADRKFLLEMKRKREVLKEELLLKKEKAMNEAVDEALELFSLFGTSEELLDDNVFTFYDEEEESLEQDEVILIKETPVNDTISIIEVSDVQVSNNKKLKNINSGQLGLFRL